MGAGLLAKAVGQSTEALNVIPHSRASPLPQGICVGYQTDARTRCMYRVRIPSMSCSAKGSASLSRP
ncbi:hypothetical protein C1894_15905 [Pseudomonas sp. FW305-3-2-15-E-TSA2]|nr:hypothetical protein C1895_15345 [Pseudomonas sp. FW305-3-2-15-E-TSA4]POA41250.1 hypothetical protein C1894_15905 [Pseudomonas sp. FW305-3-2-15-E-TSA2]